MRVRCLAVQDNVQKEIASWRSQLRKGSLELAVLIALRKQARYGLELVDLLNRAKLGMSEGSIYPLLARLRTEKKVEAEWVDTGVGHSHKYYELTPAGRGTLEAMLVACGSTGLPTISCSRRTNLDETSRACSHRSLSTQGAPGFGLAADC